MSSFSQHPVTLFEAIAVFIGIGVMISFTVLEAPLMNRIPDWHFIPGFADAMFLGMQTFLVMGCLMPAWGVAGLKYLRLRRHAEQYAGWSSARYPFTEQRIKCAIQAAKMASDRQDRAAAAAYAEIGLELSGRSLHHPEMSLSYASCLSIRGSFLENEGRLQEALEDYANATRLNLRPATLTAQYYAAASSPLYWMGRFDESILFARQAIAAAPEIEHYPLSLAYRNAALSLAELEHYSEAVQMCELGMQLEPHTAISILLMADRAWLLGMSGDEQKAEELFSALKPQAVSGVLSPLLHQEYHEVLGRLHLHQGRPEEAECLFQASLTDTTRRHLSGLYHLAKLSQNRGDKTAAQAYQERLLRESPESFYAQRVREQSQI